MKKLVIVALIAFLGALVVPAAVQAQTKEVKEVKTNASVFEKSRGADENIRTAKPTDDSKVEKPENTRGELCTIYVYNYTGYTVDIYIDGDWMGTIGAYSTAYTYAYQGETKAYGKSIGGTMYWGPQYFDCDYEYHWSLYE